MHEPESTSRYIRTRDRVHTTSGGECRGVVFERRLEDLSTTLEVGQFHENGVKLIQDWNTMWKAIEHCNKSRPRL